MADDATSDESTALFDDAVDADTTIATEDVEFGDGWSMIGLSVFEPIDADHAPSDGDDFAPIDVESSDVVRW